jgi:DNA modification methylase
VSRPPKQTAVVGWRDRIAGSGHEDPTQLVANPRNWRIHPREQQEALGDILDKVGWVQQVLVNRTTGCVVDGHLRVELAISKGEPSVPVLYIELTEDEEAVVLAALDPIAAMAAADQEKLRELLSDVALPSDLEAYLREIAGDDPVVTEMDQDDVPEVPDVPYVHPGDLYLLGEHRLLCGDATKAEDVARLLDGASPGLMVTDPPYGVDYDPSWRRRAAGKPRKSRSREGRVANDDRADWSAAWALSPTDVAYVWHGGLHADTVARGLTEAGFDLRAQIIWAKPSLIMGRGDYHWQHEPCWYAVRTGAKGRWASGRTQSTVWQIDNVHVGRGEEEATEHGTQKPIECMARPMRNHRRTEVYDPFVGSGTTIIAAEQLGRRCYAIDIDPRYVQVAKERWERLTGRTAVKEG